MIIYYHVVMVLVWFNTVVKHADMLGGDVVRCNQYKKGVDSYTRISKKYLIKYGCFGNQSDRDWLIIMGGYEFNTSPETGPNRHPLTLHTSIVV